MGVIETEYQELRSLTKKLEAELTGKGPKVDRELVGLIFKGYGECAKRTDQYLKTVSMVINSGKNARQIIGKNLISENTAIDMSSTEFGERFKCPAKGGLIICREDCLDYSGESKHIEECQRCEQFAITRKQLCPK